MDRVKKENNMQQNAHLELEKLKKKICDIFGLTLDICLIFDLKGNRLIGQCKKVSRKKYLIRLHERVLDEYGFTYINDVLTHELAHAVQMELFSKHVKPHGKEWRAILERLEDKPYEVKKRPKYTEFLNTLPKKQLKHFTYKCKCTTHQLSSIRHKRAQNGAIYRCKYCKQKLVRSDNEV